MAGPGRRKRADNPHAEGASRLAQRLRQLRERASKTQEEVAAAAGLSVATVRKIETGSVTEPGYFTVLAIASAIGVSLADLTELTLSPQLLAERPGRRRSPAATPAIWSRRRSGTSGLGPGSRPDLPRSAEESAAASGKHAPGAIGVIDEQGLYLLSHVAYIAYGRASYPLVAEPVPVGGPSVLAAVDGLDQLHDLIGEADEQLHSPFHVVPVRMPTASGGHCPTLPACPPGDPSAGMMPGRRSGSCADLAR